MEINDLPVSPEQLLQNLQQSQESILPTFHEGNSLSVYSGELTQEGLVENISRLKQAFPALPIGFYDILGEMVKEDKFTDARLTDAVRHLIKNCVYPTPTLANILSYDRRVKLYTYQEVCEYVDRGGSMDDFYKREYNGSTFRILKSEAIQKGLL